MIIPGSTDLGEENVPCSNRPASKLALIMINGHQMRHHGPDWGRKKARKPRVEWHEQKVGVFYHDDRNASGTFLEKVSIGWVGEPVELGERLHWKPAGTVWVRPGMFWRELMERRGCGP